MRKYFIILGVLLISSATFAMGNSHSEDTTQQNPSMDKAKEDYRVFLEQMKILSSQFQQVQGQMKQVIKEEGIPVWDDKTGGLKVTHDLDFSNTPVEETEDTMTVRLEIPGLQKNSIRVSIIEKKELEVSAKRKIQDDRGDVQQRISLPSLAKGSGHKASYEDGVLTVTIPKESPSKNQISVPVN